MSRARTWTRAQHAEQTARMRRYWREQPERMRAEILASWTPERRAQQVDGPGAPNRPEYRACRGRL